MKVISIVVLLATFVTGVGVGVWKPHAFTALMIHLKLQERGFDNPYYRSRLAFFRQTVGDADVVMLGDSITEGIDWRELFPDMRILNRGIGGDTSAGVLNRLDEVITRHPKVVFLMIGSNDLQTGVPVHTINDNVRSIIATLEQNQIRVVLQNVLYARAGYRAQPTNKVNELNDLLSGLCSAPPVLCLNLNKVLSEGGALSSSLSVDSLHLNTAGYLAWRDEIKTLLPP
jgi:GDSL-like Lipase/Acylhydrolase family